MDNHVHWLKLFLQPVRTQRQLIRKLIEEDQLNRPDRLAQLVDQHGTRVCPETLDRLLAWAAEAGQGFICLPDLPALLHYLPDPPVLLFYQGNPDWLNSEMLAVVGSRKPSPAGLENTQWFVHWLAKQGLSIISGMAVGIDGMAHQSALAAGQGTIAVMGCGLDHCYPRRHAKLRDQIREQGLLISEFDPRQPVNGWQFVHRNRLISGLSQGLLVIEAKMASGSLVTARLAGEQGRQVFAVPGDIQNPQVAGCHHLIREGAQLVAQPEEILEALKWNQLDLLPLNHHQSTAGDLSEQEQQVLASLDRYPRHLDLIIARTGLELTLVLEQLFSLELKGMIVSSADGYYKPNQGDTC